MDDSLERQFQDHFPTNKPRRFQLVNGVAFAVERYYLERRENFKQVLKYGEYEVPKKKVEREGFIEIAH